MRQRITIGLVKVLHYFSAIKSIQSIAGSDPQKTIVILGDIIYFITAKPFRVVSFSTKCGISCPPA